MQLFNEISYIYKHFGVKIQNIQHFFPNKIFQCVKCIIGTISPDTNHNSSTANKMLLFLLLEHIILTIAFAEKSTKIEILHAIIGCWKT